MISYELHVSLQPKYHEGQMQHMWRITQSNEDGVFTIAHGYANDYYYAVHQAEVKVTELKLV